MNIVAQNSSLCNQSLAENVTHVFCLAVPDGFGELPIQADRAAQVLNAVEQRRFDLYRIRRRRNDLVLSRMVFQVILSYLGLVGRQHWWVETDSLGKPYAASREGRATFHLNNSDSRGMIVWAFSQHGPLGCDVEFIGEDRDEVAENYFAPLEIANYRTQEGAWKQRRFYEIWTMKEAIIKADGRGLAIPLDSFLCHFDVDAAPRCEVLRPDEGPAPGPWQIRSFQPSVAHQATVAVLANGPMSFVTHALRLVSYDAGMARPWCFVEMTDSLGSGGAVEFGSFPLGG